MLKSSSAVVFEHSHVSYRYPLETVTAMSSNIVPDTQSSHHGGRSRRGGMLAPKGEGWQQRAR